jgi:hypothetical protein
VPALNVSVNTDGEFLTTELSVSPEVQRQLLMHIRAIYDDGKKEQERLFHTPIFFNK